MESEYWYIFNQIHAFVHLALAAVIVGHCSKRTKKEKLIGSQIKSTVL